MVVLWGYYLGLYYYVLLIVFLLWVSYLHDWKNTLLIILSVSFFWLFLFFPKTAFQTERKGEISYLSAAGFQIGDTFYTGDTEELVVGDVLQVKGKQTGFRKMNNPGGFDEKHFLMGKGVHFVAEVQSYQKLAHHHSLVQYALDWIEKHCYPSLVPIYEYLLLGVKDERLDSLQTMAKNLAILHIFAISGMHFGIIQRFIRKIFSYICDENKAAWLTLAVLSLYAVLLKGNVAAWRAYLMLLLGKLTTLTRLQRFGLVGCFFLWWEPQIIFNMAFIFSMSTYFLVIVTGKLRFANGLIYIGSMWISTYFQYEIYPLGYFAGLLFSALITSLFPLFILDVLLGGYLGFLNLVLYQGLQSLMEKCCDLSFSWITGQPPFLFCVCGYLVLLYVIYQWQFYHRRWLFSLVPLCFALVFLLPFLSPYGRVVMLDVGQGDCFFIQLPFQKANLMIDTGGLSYQDVAVQRIIPFLKSQGVRRLDALYISHDDYDHSGAKDSLVAHFEVQQVITAFTKDTWGQITFQQLNPQNSHDANDDSLVIGTRLGQARFLFCGDISVKTEEQLVTQYPKLKVDVLKIAHHGSGGSTSNRFLAALQPKVALISVGEHNLYRHPNQEVLERLQSYGCEIYRTDQEGAVTIYFNKNHTWIEKKKKG